VCGIPSSAKKFHSRDHAIALERSATRKLARTELWEVKDGVLGNTEVIQQSPRGGQPPLCPESWTSDARHGNQGLEQVPESSRGDKISSMNQPQVGRTGVVQLRLGQKRPPIGPMLLAFSAWFISLPSAVFGLFWCLHWMVPKSPAHLPIPEFLAYPFYIILWIGSALAAIATISFTPSL
jgi:hypothetical protein